MAIHNIKDHEISTIAPLFLIIASSSKWINMHQCRWVDIGQYKLYQLDDYV